MTRTLEVRTGRAGRVELRVDQASGVAVLTGYALKYGAKSQDLGGFIEQIAPGALDRTLGDGGRIMARYNHDDNWLLGTTDGGTLALKNDDTGLRYEITLPDTSAGRDVRELASRGDVHHSSFAFYTQPDGDEWSTTESGYPLRTLTAIRLVDVAPVNSPAYLDTTSGLRSLSARTGLGVDAIATASVEEVRALILGERVPRPVAGNAPGIDQEARNARRLLIARLAR